jgi:hypothetical protein
VGSCSSRDSDSGGIGADAGERKECISVEKQFSAVGSQ